MTKTKPKPDTRHGVVDYGVNPPLMRCHHCDASHPLFLPLEVSKMVQKLRAFTVLHADCEAP